MGVSGGIGPAKPGVGEEQISIHRLRLELPAEGQVTAPLQLQPLEDECGHLFRDGRSPLYGTEEHWRRFSPESDRSLPLPIKFAWEPVYLDGSRVRYELELYPEDAPGERVLLRGLAQPYAEVENLRIGTTYAWKVRARNGRHLVGQSASGHFITHPSPPRWIHVPGITNVRDLGGWPLQNGQRIRQGMLFRGSEMNSHCMIQELGRKVLLEDLGVRTDLDLRGPGEDRQPVLDQGRVDYINLPLASYDMIANPDFTRRYRALFKLLSMPEVYPIFMHCWGGADRTGTVAFLLGALLGMRDEDLITEYELTSLSIWGDRLSESEAFQEMLTTLELFAPAGSPLQSQVERYLNVIGVQPHEIQSIRQILTTSI